MSRPTRIVKDSMIGLDMPDIDVWSERVTVVLGQNPGPFTGPGTNTYLIGTSTRPLLLDTGQGVPAYLPLLDAIGPFAEASARLRAMDTGDTLTSRLDALATIAAALDGHARVTLDPTERHGFEYQTWLGVSLFADAIAGEVGRGGTYALIHAGGRREPATGVSLFLDPLMDAAADQSQRRRLFLPVGHDPAAAARLRSDGWVTVRAFAEEDTPGAQCCTHILVAAEARPI